MRGAITQPRRAPALRSACAAGAGAVKSGQSCPHFVPSAGSVAVEQVRLDGLVRALGVEPVGREAVVRRVAVAGHRQQARVAELLHEPLGLLVRRGRVVARADDERRRVAPRGPERTVVLVARPDRIQAPVQLGVAVVPERVVVVLVRALAGLQERLDPARVVLLVRAEQEVPVRAGRVAAVVVAAPEPVGDRADPVPVAGLELPRARRAARPTRRSSRPPAPGRRGCRRRSRAGPARRTPGSASRRPARSGRRSCPSRRRRRTGTGPGARRTTIMKRLIARSKPAVCSSSESSGSLMYSVRVERAVEHDRAGPAREQALDGRPEERAVGEPEVRHLSVADRRADRVEVPRHVRRRHVLQVVVAPRCTARCSRGPCGAADVRLSGVVRGACSRAAASARAGRPCEARDGGSLAHARSGRGVEPPTLSNAPAAADGGTVARATSRPATSTRAAASAPGSLVTSGNEPCRAAARRGPRHGAQRRASRSMRERRPGERLVVNTARSTSGPSRAALRRCTLRRAAATSQPWRAPAALAAATDRRGSGPRRLGRAGSPAHVGDVAAPQAGRAAAAVRGPGASVGTSRPQLHSGRARSSDTDPPAQMLAKR